ncbi:aminotransferase class I/II-fold pyridoxal phosphate-dependent enzyme [Phyllobacterium sp. LjRoot231]|uniref:aminotransferase class I/II-fold pyridoxal phosphate-dependent enzyme n=1 Tax=Phyllobacterium sp. LjRoot231 TaxID=3342289 RepID=UPI003ECEC959
MNIGLLKTSTDYEQFGAKKIMNLSDGHAAHELDNALFRHVESLPDIWNISSSLSNSEAIERYVGAFSNLAGTGSLNGYKNFVICPTASNAIDIVGAVLRERRALTALVEPTFDNIALLLRRRGVTLLSISDHDTKRIGRHTDDGSVSNYVSADAIFLVNPNNPLGTTLGRDDLCVIAEYCNTAGKILILDNSFRFHKRKHFDDYRILLDSGVSFISFEDTGKVWPTHEIKASLMVFSEDLSADVRTVYNELYLCSSTFALILFESLMRQFYASGLKPMLWDVIDDRWDQITNSLQDSVFGVSPTTGESRIGLCWLDIHKSAMSDLQMVRHLSDRGVSVLPGRHFHWDSGHMAHNQKNIRISLLRPRQSFVSAMRVLGQMQSNSFSKSYEQVC